MEKSHDMLKGYLVGKALFEGSELGDPWRGLMVRAFNEILVCHDSRPEHEANAVFSVARKCIGYELAGCGEAEDEKIETLERIVSASVVAGVLGTVPLLIEEYGPEKQTDSPILQMGTVSGIFRGMVHIGERGLLDEETTGALFQAMISVLFIDEREMGWFVLNSCEARLRKNIEETGRMITVDDLLPLAQALSHNEHRWPIDDDEESKTRLHDLVVNCLVDIAIQGVHPANRLDAICWMVSNSE